MRLDLSGEMGDLFPNKEPALPMYSYSRPADILWNAIANGMVKRGFSEEQIRDWLQSKSPRYALDNELGDMIEAVGAAYAEKNL